MLEIFMMYLGVGCREIGYCLFITGTTQDRDMIQRYWLLSIGAGSSSDDSGDDVFQIISNLIKNFKLSLLQ